MYNNQIEKFRSEYPEYRAVLTQRFTFCESWLILALDNRREKVSNPYYFCFWWNEERGIFKILAQGTREDCKKTWDNTRTQVYAHLKSQKNFSLMGV
jgi:hypothetical protein